MNRSVRLLAAFAVSGCAAIGCASFAKRPPTPAAEISPREASAIVSPPDERYYILVFGSQSVPKRAKFTRVVVQ